MPCSAWMYRPSRTNRKIDSCMVLALDYNNKSLTMSSTITVAYIDELIFNRASTMVEVFKNKQD